MTHYQTQHQKLSKYNEDQIDAYIKLEVINYYSKEDLIKMKVRGSKALRVPYVWPGRGLIHCEYTIDELLAYK